MGYLFVFIITAIIFSKVGVKYGELRDLMLAKRISKMIINQQQVAKDMEQYKQYVRADEKLAKVMTDNDD